jgi:molecular chaperone GrpE
VTSESSENAEAPREEGRQEPVVVRDRRRIDPKTGRRRVSASDQQEVTESMSGTLHDDLAEAAPESNAESGA